MLLVSLDIEDEFLVSFFFVAQHPNLMIQPMPSDSNTHLSRSAVTYVYTRDWPASEKRKKQLSWEELSRERKCVEENPLQT